ncbi:MAG: FkbM family methyltransferase [Myxococcota bacterium]|jgi:FkbM family methyltransferase
MLNYRKYIGAVLVSGFIAIAGLTVGCEDTSVAPIAPKQKPVKGKPFAQQAPARSALPRTLRKHEAGKILLEGKKLYSQNNEELIIRDFFNDRRGGFFLDIGAASAIFNSTTYYLEERLGWRGIGVDALPRYGPRWAEKRPKSLFVNYAISDKSGETMTFYEHDWPEVSSLSKEQASQFGGEEKLTEVEVKTITLNDLLEKYGVNKVDHLTIDIEGAEMFALNGFDIERYKPDLICIEAHTRGKQGEDEIRGYFEAHGYELLKEYLRHDIPNWYFAPVSASEPATPAS